jgi:hypothetical protein
VASRDVAVPEGTVSDSPSLLGSHGCVPMKELHVFKNSATSSSA